MALSEQCLIYYKAGIREGFSQYQQAHIVTTLCLVAIIIITSVFILEPLFKKRLSRGNK